MIKSKTMLVFYIFTSLLLSGVVVDINGEKITEDVFFSNVSRFQWGQSDSVQKNSLFSDFLDRQLCVQKALSLGLLKNPLNDYKARQRYFQLLVNQTYEVLVANALVPKENISIAKNFLKKELFINHILISFEKSALPSPSSRSEKQAFERALLTKKSILDNFSDVALDFSDDPGVKNNSGSLGWVGWGRTDPVFQRAVFNLPIGVVSDPILTRFGYHIVLVDSIKNSPYFFASNYELETLAYNIEKNIIRSSLPAAAARFDSVLIDKYEVIFNAPEVSRLASFYKASTASTPDINPIIALEALDFSGVLCVFNQKGYGLKWFLHRLSALPSSQLPVFDDASSILASFRLVVLRELAVIEGSAAGINTNPSFLTQWLLSKSGLLYDFYLKHLIGSVVVPDSLEVFNYYEENKNVRYMSNDSSYLPLARVYSRIETSLLRSKQNNAVKQGVSDLKHSASLNVFPPYDKYYKK